MRVQERREDGKLEKEKSFVIKGVAWSPASAGTTGDRQERIAQFKRWYQADLDLIQKMNANTVYTFLDFGTDESALQILDELQRRKLKAIVTVDMDGMNDLDRIREIVGKYKNHPAILMWAIGNEWNINLHHRRFSSLRESALATEAAARLVKKLDKNHPVASIFGEIIIQGATVPTAEIVNQIAPSVDVWGLNIYRGDSFGDLFEHWKSFSSKPIFISEFGTDSFLSKSWWPVVGVEDEAMQAKFVASLWRHLGQNLSACDPRKVALGGMVFEWVDEWWKVKSADGGDERRQDSGGFPTHWNKFSHPDGFANEEYFGIVKIDRRPKALYKELKRLYSLEPCSKP